MGPGIVKHIDRCPGCGVELTFKALPKPGGLIIAADHPEGVEECDWQASAGEEIADGEDAQESGGLKAWLAARWIKVCLRASKVVSDATPVPGHPGRVQVDERKLDRLADEIEQDAEFLGGVHEIYEERQAAEEPSGGST